MGLFSFLRKKETTDDSAFGTRTAEEGATRGRGKKRQKANEPVDPVLPEKQRARRRLVGAVALVLAAVIGVPMILDPEPKPLAHDISIDIPSKDKPRQAAAQPDGAAPPAAAVDSSDAATGTRAPLPAAETPPVAQDIPPDSKPVGNANDRATADASKPAPKAQPAASQDVKAAESNAAANGDAKSEAKRAEEARVRALLAGKPDPGLDKVKLDTDKARYVVQVAALSSVEKAQELQNRLKVAGIQTHTQKVAIQSGGQVIRIRVGPVQGRSEAEKIRAKLVKLGLTGTLVPV